MFSENIYLTSVRVSAKLLWKYLLWVGPLIIYKNHWSPNEISIDPSSLKISNELPYGNPLNFAERINNLWE